MGFQIAIDGPAGAGKSTIAKAVAAKRGCLYIDTGAMYRALGLYCLANHVDIDNEEEVVRAVRDVELDIRLIDGIQHVFLQGEDTGDKIRTEEVGMAASRISTYGDVRRKLVSLQQHIAGEHDVIMDGRDIGTVVLPDAPLKIYLTASARTRALRRLKDLEARGESGDLAVIEADIEARDEQDMTRKESPLRRAEDAVYLDTSDMSIDEVTDSILALAIERQESVWKS